MPPRATASASVRQYRERGASARSNARSRRWRTLPPGAAGADHPQRAANCRRRRGLPAPRTPAATSACSSSWLGFRAPSNVGTVMACIAAAERAVGEVAECCDHDCSSPIACRTARSRDRQSASLWRPMRLLSDAAEIEIAAVLAHRGDHGVVDRLAGPRTIPAPRPVR